jgi:hypothetical protein
MHKGLLITIIGGGPDILADNQAKFLLSQPTLTHLDASGKLLQRDIQRIIKQYMLQRIFLFIIVGTLMHVRLL